MASPEIIQGPEVFKYEDGFVPTNDTEVRLQQTVASNKELDSLLNLEGYTTRNLQKAIFFDIEHSDVGSAEHIREMDDLLKEFTEASKERKQEIAHRLIEFMP